MYGKLNKTVINQAIAKIKVNKKTVTLSDGARLQLRLSSKYLGKGSWSIVLGSKENQSRITIGEYHHFMEGFISIEKAREMALALRKSYKDGTPASIVNVSKSNSLTMQSLITLYLDFKKPQLAFNSLRQYQSVSKILSKTELSRTTMENITPLLIKQELDKIASSANNKSYFYSFIKSVVDYGTGNRLIDPCPLPKFSQLFPEKVEVKSRKALELSELNQFFKDLKKLNLEHIANLLLIILTACRCNEVLKRTKQDIIEPFDSGFMWHIPAERMKKGREHTVFIKQEVAKLLDWESLPRGNLIHHLKKIGFNATLHGFRALFFSTMIERLPQYKDAISACIAHGKDLANQSDKSYHRYDYANEKVIVFTAWFEILKQHGLQELLDLF
ncbi:tyrosine-type recombinase/integrase [Psittacicella hinzii]|uniref:tyrosine-type recombinase/integrase n=1 Tax=Psittacicella hinzii TaxID=2028575 RepID=UPI003615A0FA